MVTEESFRVEPQATALAHVVLTDQVLSSLFVAVEVGLRDGIVAASVAQVPPDTTVAHHVHLQLTICAAMVTTTRALERPNIVHINLKEQFPSWKSMCLLRSEVEQKVL